MRGVPVIKFEIDRVLFDADQSSSQPDRGEFQAPEFKNASFAPRQHFADRPRDQTIALQNKWKANYSRSISRSICKSRPTVEASAGCSSPFNIARGWDPVAKKFIRT